MSDMDEFDETKKGFSITALVLGIVGLVLSCTGIGFIAGILAIIFGGISIYKKEGIKGMAIAGLVLGILSIVGWVLLFLLGLAALAGMSSLAAGSMAGTL